MSPRWAFRRRWNERGTAPMSEDDDKLERMLGRLGSPNEADREAAKKHVRALTPDQLVKLVDLEASRDGAWMSRAAVLTVACYTLAFVVIVSICAALGVYKDRSVFTTGIGMLFAMQFRYLYAQMPRARRSLNEVIEGVDDVDFIPACLSLLQTRSVPVRESMNGVLTRLLPQVRKGQADDWTSKQTQQFLTVLDTPIGNPELTLCVLKALEQIGDEAALPAVRKLANLKTEITIWDKIPRMSKEEQQRRRKMIREAAEACLPFLEMRLEDQMQAQTLLRASEASATPETLLRAAEHASTDKAPEQLLRPKSGD